MIRIQSQVPLAPLTTFQIGGNARYFVEVSSEDEVREALAWAKEHHERFVVLAGGSNVLISDEGFAGLVIHSTCKDLSFHGDTLTADAGCTLLTLMKAASEQGLGGWERLAGIPGSIGGAARGNAGAFGSEIKDFVVSVRALNAQTGEAREFANTDCIFLYRQSFFKSHPEWIIMSMQVRLAPIDLEESRRLIEETIAERERRHLQNVRAAGSYFMNPRAPQAIIAQFEKEKETKSREGRVPAGWLIEKVGMKGARQGSAIASEQHPNYIVNEGGANAKDVRDLAYRIKTAVHMKFQIELEEEAADLGKMHGV